MFSTFGCDRLRTRLSHSSRVLISVLLNSSNTKVILQENERLYVQMKAQQAKSKANEEAMFNENKRLLNELEFTRFVNTLLFAYVFR